MQNMAPSAPQLWWKVVRWRLEPMHNAPVVTLCAPSFIKSKMFMSDLFKSWWHLACYFLAKFCHCSDSAPCLVDSLVAAMAIHECLFVDRIVWCWFPTWHTLHVFLSKHCQLGLCKREKRNFWMKGGRAQVNSKLAYTFISQQHKWANRNQQSYLTSSLGI